MDNLDTIAKSTKGIQGTIDELLTRFKNLSKFEEAAVWDGDAEAVLKLVEQYNERIRKFISSQEQALEELKSSRASQSFAKKMFASRKDEKSIETDLAAARKGIEENEETIDTLYELMDRTPSSKAEQAEMLKEFRQLKKELTTEKRAVNEEIRAIRAEARQKTTRMTGISGSGFMGSAARYSRASIRYQKESALRPNEDAKAAIERQLINIEKRINWVSRFSGDDPETRPDEILRCSYCGRRVEPNSVCPGCGSDRTMLSKG